MSTALTVLAAVAAIAGFCLLVWRAQVGRELALVIATRTSTAREAAALPPGSVVVLMGQLSTEAPLKGKFSGRDCIYFRALIEREIERDDRDADGIGGTHRFFETVSSTEEHTPSRLSDGSGSVAVDFTGAKVEGVLSHQHYVAGAHEPDGSIKKSRGTVLGHRYTEWIIPPGSPVYILATARAGGVIGASPTQSNPFFISHKSEKERIWSLEATLLWLRVAAVSSFLLAIALLIWAGVSA